MTATLLDKYESGKRQSPLRHAVAMGGAQAVAFFANHLGYDQLVIHDKLHKLLLVAARATPFNEEVCRILLWYMRATLLDKYNRGERQSPLHTAIFEGKVDATRYFANNLGGGYFIAASNSYLGQPPFDAAAETPHKSPEVFRTLKEVGADPNQFVRRSGRARRLATPLTSAARRNDVDAVRLLLEEGGADPCICAVDRYNYDRPICRAMDLKNFDMDRYPIRYALLHGSSATIISIITLL
jgi:Ankyrin repeat